MCPQISFLSNNDNLKVAYFNYHLFWKSLEPKSILRLSDYCSIFLSALMKTLHLLLMYSAAATRS